MIIKYLTYFGIGVLSLIAIIFIPMKLIEVAFSIVDISLETLIVDLTIRDVIKLILILMATVLMTLIASTSVFGFFWSRRN